VPGLDVHEVLRVTEPRSLLTVLGKDALMVVVGARGLGAAREGLLGSVGRSLTRHPPCPVVVHRTPADETLPEVLVGFDGSARSTPVLELAFRLADQRELALRLLHCSRQTPTVTPGAWASARPVAPDAEKRAVAERVAALIEKYPDVRAVADIEWGDPEALLVAASGQRAMVVLGAHHPGHAGPLPASVTTTVLERARCPVAVVPL
jgi:nucleotide-binding universal stress UspA family protein